MTCQKCNEMKYGTLEEAATFVPKRYVYGDSKFIFKM